MISFKLMRTGWIPATPLRKAGKGEEAPGVIPFKHGQRKLSSIVVNLGDLQSEPSDDEL